MTISPNITLKILTREDLYQVALVHSMAFDDSALTKLGIEPIRRYYEWQLTGPHECHAIGAFDSKDSLVGFCFAGVFHGSLSGFLKHNRRFLTWWILTHPWKITNPLVMDRLKQAIGVLRHKPSTNTRVSVQSKRSYGILSIAVDPKMQGYGVGRLIMKNVKDDAIKKGFTEMGLTVHPTNINAILFYEKNGWVKINNNREVEWAGRMLLPLHQ